MAGEDKKRRRNKLTIPGEDKKKKKSKKRSGDTPEVGQIDPPKIPQSIENEPANFVTEMSSPWTNFELINSLKDKEIDLLKRVELAFNYVNSSSRKEMDVTIGCSQVLNISRTLDFLNDWIQLVMISPEKQMRPEERKPEFERPELCLDIRCWKILRFCLKESKNYHVSFTCLRDILRVLRCIVLDASSTLALCHEGTLSAKQVEFYQVVVDCTSMVFSFHGGVSKENLDLWISLMDKVLELISKIYKEQIDGSHLGNFVLQLTCCLLEPFANFLKVHPTRKKGFHDFVDKLVEPLLHLSYILQSNSFGSKVELRTNLSKLVGEVLAQGLFHPTHIDGFLNSPSGRYRDSSDIKEEKLVNKSYHRHLFDKVETIVAEKNGLALVGLGKMFHLFVSCVTKHKGASVGGGSSGQLGSSYTSIAATNPPGSRKLILEKNTGCLNVDAELRKSIFYFFVQIMEYLLSDVNKYLQSDREELSILFEVSSTFGSINNLLESFLHEKVYLRTEDTSEGASKNFLSLIYKTIMSFSTESTHLQTSLYGSDKESHRELLIHLRKGLIVSVNHLLNIEYEVVGDDLESIWAMVFSSVTCCNNTSTDVLDQPLLPSEIHTLACRLIDLYSELRQVHSSIFALCRAIRHSASLLGDRKSRTSSLSISPFSNLLSMLLCSLEFRLSLSNAIKAIPEGQASGLIQMLSSDIKESLEWIKFEHQMASAGENAKSGPHNRESLQFNLRTNLLGKVLSELYAIILDSITVSSGNSQPFGGVLNDLINIIRPSLSSLVSLQPISDGIKEFDVVIDGVRLDKNVSSCWILVFLFRLLLSCKCLFRKAISLMPPDASKKMAGVIGDSFGTYTGRDWLDLSGCADGGYFSWISHSSSPLLNVIRSVSDIYTQDSIVICPPLAYVLHVMALQRLVDLNRLVKSSEYMLQWNQTLCQNKSKDDGDVSSDRKKTRKWKKRVLELREEATNLSKFMLGSNPSFKGGIDVTVIQGMNDNGTLNFAVGSLDEKLLPLALWQIICQNVDLWCLHAAKKDLKDFLTHLIQASVSSGSAHGGRMIALEFLSNTIPYEQKFIRRYMESRFCKILQKSVISIFATSGVDLSKPPDWVELMSTVESLSDLPNYALTSGKPCVVPDKPYSIPANSEFATCQCLLALMMRMPEEYLSSRSSSLYITYILNLERLLVGSMSGKYKASSSQSHYDSFRLFVSCRRVLKVLTAASCKKIVNGSPLKSEISESLFPLSWLLKSLSAILGSQQALLDTDFETKVAILSLMDNTSNVLLTVSRDQFERKISSAYVAKKLRKKRKSLDPATEESNLSGHDIKLKPKKILDDCKSVLQLAETLEEHMQNSLATFKDVPLDKKVECLAGSQELNKLSSIISCFLGLLEGLASALSDANAVDGNNRINFSSYNAELMTRIDSSVSTCMDCVTFFLKAFFLKEDLIFISSVGLDDAIGTRVSSSGPSDVSTDALNERKCSFKKGKRKRDSSLAIPDLEVFLNEVDHVGECLNRPLLLKIMGGENAEAAFFCRQLFKSCSAILRLNSLIDLTSFSWGLFPVAVGISQFLLLEFSNRSEIPHLFDFCWLDGVVDFLEVLGSYFPQLDPLLSKDFYIKLVDLHIKAIGKCISLQGREAKVASQEAGSHSKMLTSKVQNCHSLESNRLGEFKAKLRMSFRTYVKESSELHLVSAIQAVERALVGVHEGLITNYEILCGSSSDGGEVSSVVAAGIDCLDLILGFVTEHKRTVMIKRHIQSFIACLFNIIVHLQAPCIFYGHVDSVKGYAVPDSGPVVSMCIETLTTISAKSSFFIDACHVAQSLRVPGALFQYFLQLQLTESTYKSSEISTRSIVLDRSFSVELYAGCCRLLSSALKHHKNETWHSLALLQDSVSVLLHCLEIVNTDPVLRRDMFALEVQEAVKCASNLRRVYEEVRQQKDVFGHTAFQFLSRYIWVYCGFGPAKRGIIREIDEALKPGIYALIDSCSADDLQLLHSQFGEGPCRSTLSNLQHDYKLKFQYGGKV